MNQFFLFGPLTGLCFALDLIALGACLALCFPAPPSERLILFTVGTALLAAGQIGYARRRARARLPAA